MWTQSLPLNSKFRGGQTGPFHHVQLILATARKVEGHFPVNLDYRRAEKTALMSLNFLL